MTEPTMARGEDILVTTTLEIPGTRIVRYFGIVRGITVRTRGLVGQLAAGLRTVVGGPVETYISMCEYARQEALDLMLQHAREHGANAVLGMRYDATELGQGITEVLAYGTAVLIEPISKTP